MVGARSVTVLEGGESVGWSARPLVEAARRGDEDAFAALVPALSDRLYSIALRVLRDADLASDAVQQTLLSIWRDLPKLRDLNRFDAWTYRLLLRACFREARNRRRWIASVQPLHAASYRSDESDTLADVDQLDRAFRRISPAHRAIVVLHFYVGLSLTETAAAVGVPVGTARSRLHYAIAALRAAVDADALDRGATR